MATKIRLRRMGSRNKPFYRLVAADSRFATTGRFLEALGWYDPKKTTDGFSVNIERVDYWLGNGAQLSATAKSLVKKAKAGEGVPYGSAPEKKAPGAAVETAAPAVEEKPVAGEAPAAAEVEEEVNADAEEEKKAEETAPAEEPAEAKEDDASDKKEA